MGTGLLPVAGRGATLIQPPFLASSSSGLLAALPQAANSPSLPLGSAREAHTARGGSAASAPLWPPPLHGAPSSSSPPRETRRSARAAPEEREGHLSPSAARLAIAARRACAVAGLRGAGAGRICRRHHEHDAGEDRRDRGGGDGRRRPHGPSARPRGGEAVEPPSGASQRRSSLPAGVGGSS